jgi:hypothetical protein
MMEHSLFVYLCCLMFSVNDSEALTLVLNFLDLMFSPFKFIDLQTNLE